MIEQFENSFEAQFTYVVLLQVEEFPLILSVKLKNSRITRIALFRNQWFYIEMHTKLKVGNTRIVEILISEQL